VNEYEIVVVIPAYRSELTIVSAVAQVFKTLQSCDSSFLILVVFDGKDEEAQRKLLEANFLKTKIVEININSGKGNALRTGIATAPNCRYLAYIDSDLDINSSALKSAYLKLQQDSTLDLVVGSKHHHMSKVDYPKIRKVQSLVFAKSVQLLFRLQIDDTQTGLKMGKGSEIKRTAKETHLNGFAFDLEFILECKRNHLRMTTIPIVLNYKFESTISFQSYIKTIWDVITILYFEIRRKLSRGGFFGQL
jgi:dolichyl-phosphate beta-glucosyltransferase